MSSYRKILSQGEIDRALTRISYEILERNKGTKNLVLMGIASRGFPLAQRICTNLSAAEPLFDPAASIGQLDITMFRDDLTKNPIRTPSATNMPALGIDMMKVVLVDDVFYSGRTVRAALDALSAFGRPQKVQLAVLVDRGHRELPIQADYVGKNISSAHDENIKVLLAESDNVTEDAVLIDRIAGEGR